jgi:hypothetical protein
MLGNDPGLTENDHQAERSETERRPSSSSIALAPPLVDRDHRKRHVGRQTYVPQNLYRKLQRHPLGPGP